MMTSSDRDACVARCIKVLVLNVAVIVDSMCTPLKCYRVDNNNNNQLSNEKQTKSRLLLHCRPTMKRSKRLSS